MPNSPGYKRDYKKEYQNYHGTPEQRRKNDSRKKARRLMEAKGKVRKGDGKDVAHLDNNPKNNRTKNLAVQKPAINRSFKRTKNAGMKK